MASTTVRGTCVPPGGSGKTAGAPSTERDSAGNRRRAAETSIVYGSTFMTLQWLLRHRLRRPHEHSASGACNTLGPVYAETHSDRGDREAGRAHEPRHRLTAGALRRLVRPVRATNTAAPAAATSAAPANAP